MAATTRKKSTNLSLDADLIGEAKALQVNVSHAAETGVRRAVQQAKAEMWLQENAPAIEGWNKWVEENGLPLDRYRQF